MRSRILRESAQAQKRRIALTMMMHTGSALIAAGVVMLILDNPNRLWGCLSVAAGLLVWLQMLRRLRLLSKDLAENGE
ncbi:MAG: hypothetical protein JSU93_03700 [Methanobacteriota archaeon]|nr:MAG: hypothetical protein JSU93_03700 [Euryarchaeota archaeon]